MAESRAFGRGQGRYQRTGLVAESRAGGRGQG